MTPELVHDVDVERPAQLNGPPLRLRRNTKLLALSLLARVQVTRMFPPPALAAKHDSGATTDDEYFTHQRAVQLARRRLRGALFLRATLRTSPTPASVVISDVPPADMNGSGTPVIGRTPMTAPMLMNA